MLKWLVTKNPSNSTEQIFTEDPFATLNRNKATKNEFIYSVSRVNPLYEDEVVGDVQPVPKDSNKDTSKRIEKRQFIPSSPPESPPSDRESVKSSGYGSKEADSVSYQSDNQDADEGSRHQINGSEVEDAMNNATNLNSPSTVSQLCKSFENLNGSRKAASQLQFDIAQKDPNYVNSIEVIQSQNIPNNNKAEDTPMEALDSNRKQQWPKVSHLANALKRQTKIISEIRTNDADTRRGAMGQGAKSQILRFNPLVSVVAQDRRYVTAISVSPNSKANKELRPSYLNTHKPKHTNQNTAINPDDSSVPAYFKSQSSQQFQEYPLLSLQPDSLVTEDTLKMMKYPDYRVKSRKNSSDSDHFGGHCSADMPLFGKTIYSGFHSAGQSESSNRSEYVRSVTSSDRSISAKKTGPCVVKDLWEKSGLKTNGRKFLVDVNDLVKKSEQLSENDGSSAYNQERVFSVSHYMSSNPHFVKSNPPSRPQSRRFSNNYDDNAYSISTTESSSNYERVIDDYKHGIDNSAFADDFGRLHGNNFKSRPSFHHNLTSFQKKVTDRMESEPSHRKSWVDLDKNPVLGDNIIINKDGTSRESTGSWKQNRSISRHYPGKAVRELGLVNEPKTHMLSYYSRPWNRSNRDYETPEHSTRNNDERRRFKFWDYQWKTNLKDASLSSFFSPHPNCSAIYERGSDVCHDFTLDAFKLHRLSSERAKRKYRRRCSMIILILVALLCFLGAIVGISLYLTNGQRLFGAM